MINKKNKLNILMIASTFPVTLDDFRNKMILDFAIELVKAGNNVTVLAPTVSGVQEKFYNIEGVDVKRFHYFFFRKLELLCEGAGIPANIHRNLLTKLQIVFYVFSSIINVLIKKHKKYDVIHVHWPIPNGFAALILKVIKNIPIINTLYGAEIYLSKKYHILPVLKFLTNRAVTNVAISKGTNNIAVNVGIKNLKLIPLGVNTNTFHPLKIKRNSKTIKIISVGRLVERKGFEYLLIAFAKILKIVKNVELDIVGIGPLEKKLKNLSYKLNISNFINFLGSKSHKDINILYNKADIFVLPSIIDSNGDTEGLGLVYLEAMSCKLPVIGTKVGGIPDIVKNNFNGILVKEKDPDELFDALLLLISNKKLRFQLGKNGFNFVYKKYTWEKIAYKYLKLYKSILY